MGGRYKKIHYSYVQILGQNIQERKKKSLEPFINVALNVQTGEGCLKKLIQYSVAREY